MKELETKLNDIKGFRAMIDDNLYLFTFTNNGYHMIVFGGTLSAPEVMEFNYNDDIETFIFKNFGYDIKISIINIIQDSDEIEYNLKVKNNSELIYDNYEWMPL